MKFNPLTLLSLSLAVAVGVGSCGAPTPDASSSAGRQQLIDQANKALTTSDCATALGLLLPVYQSVNTDNTIRMMTASAYGCWATIDYFTLIGNLVTNATTLAGPTFWNFMAQSFPSTSGGADHVVEGAVLASDAAMAALKTGIPILPSNEINPNTYNVGSIYGSDRIADANLYLLLTSMAAIGGIENRYGLPSVPGYHPTVALPWTKATSVTADGCAYGSSVVNFFDAISLISSIVPSNLSSSLKTVQSKFSAVIDLACDYGCTGVAPPNGSLLNPLNKWVATGCSFASGCTASRGCPSTLKNRSSCSYVATDVNSCAAAGIANLVNYSLVGWQ